MNAFGSSGAASAPDPSEPRIEFLSVIIPAYNEEARLSINLPKIRDYCRTRTRRFEILVIDDGSIDGTAALVRAEPEARLIQLERNSGKGAAVRAGMLQAAGETLLFTDADLSTPIEEMDLVLVHLLRGADVVIGSRDLPESRIERHQNPMRESMGKIFNLLVRLLGGLPFKDTQCGFKCYRRLVAREIFSKCRIDGFAFDVETLIIARRLGYHVVEMPVRWIDCPRSKVRILRHPMQMLIDLMRIRARDLRRRYI